MIKISTEELPEGQFKVHGKVELLKHSEEILIFHATGPFNMELLHALLTLEKVFLNELKSEGRQWAEVIIFEKNCMAVNEAASKFPAYLDELKSISLSPKATAFVIGPNVEGLSRMKEHYEKSFRAAELEFAIFNCEQDAIAWVNQYL